VVISWVFENPPFCITDGYYQINKCGHGLVHPQQNLTYQTHHKELGFSVVHIKIILILKVQCSCG
jgi:hypothetical protein